MAEGWSARFSKRTSRHKQPGHQGMGVFEYWNSGTFTEGAVDFAKQLDWPIKDDLSSLVGRRYKAPVCFVYHINAEGKIDLVREYLVLDSGSVMAQLSKGIQMR